ncbi:transcriptional regulator [Sorangium sp. So ce542]|uniref:transcriptional regulator n=1 Tax=Sorangium sp. So ce542 TaxID=3133316 RepID=UPI003F5D6E52
MQLYLIPLDGGQGGRVPTRRSYHRSRSLSLTPDETRTLRAALRGLKARLGSWRAVSAAMGGVHVRTLAGVACGIGRGSPALVLLAARVAETTVERILSPGVVEAGKCAACGRSG